MPLAAQLEESNPVFVAGNHFLQRELAVLHTSHDLIQALHRVFKGGFVGLGAGFAHGVNH
jgi:hypothetical protein